MITLALVGVAAAHPFGARFAAHRVEVHADRDQAEVHYLAEVPRPLVDSRGVSGMQEELRAGLLVLVDGVAASTPTRLDKPIRNDDSYRFVLHRSVPTPPGGYELVVSNGNLPDVRAYHSAIATVGPGVRVLDSSLLRQGAFDRMYDDSGAWKLLESSRILRLELDPEPDLLAPLTDALLGEPAAVRPLLKARARPDSDALLTRYLSGSALLVGFALATTLGLCTRRRAGLVGLGGGGVLAAALWSVPWMGAALGASILALVVAATIKKQSSWQSAAAGVACAAVAASIHAPSASAVALLCSVAGMAVGWRRPLPAQVVATVVAGAAAVVLLRG